MKKIASLIMAALMLATMLCAFAVPASAEGDLIVYKPNLAGISITTDGNYILSQDSTKYKIKDLIISSKDCTLTIPEGITVTVTHNVDISLGTLELNGTLDVSQCLTNHSGFSGETNINIGKTGTLIKSNSDSMVGQWVQRADINISTYEQVIENFSENYFLYVIAQEGSNCTVAVYSYDVNSNTFPIVYIESGTLKDTAQPFTAVPKALWEKAKQDFPDLVPTASTLSEGSLTIIVGVAAAVVFGLGGFFIGKAVGKKKKTA